MRSRLPNWIRLGMVLAVIAGTQTGCKSGWKMPGSDMFSWTRKPSESTLAGTGPSIAMPSAGTPTSPSTKSSPTPINSTALNNTKPSSPYGQGVTSPYGQPSAPNATNALGSVPGAGTAATQNGYSTGNYATTPQRPMGGTAPNYGVPGGPAPTGNNQLAQNPYGQSAYGLPPNGPAAGGPTAGGLVAGGPVPTGPVPGGPTAYGAPQGYPAPTRSVAGPNSLPPTGSVAYGMTPPPAAPGVVPNGIPNTNAYVPNAGTNSVPTNMVSYGAGSLPPSLPPASSMPNAYGGGAAPSVPTYTGPASYRPGSTARPTSYDFSNQAPAGGTAPGAAGYPRSATELPSNMNR